LWIVIFFAAILSLADIASDCVFYSDSKISMWLSLAGLSTFAVLKATALTSLWLIPSAKWISKHRYINIPVRCAVIVIITVFIILSIANGIGTLTYDLGISRKLVRILSQTNTDEIREFLPGLAYNIWSLISSYLFWVVITLAAISTYLISCLSTKTFNILAAILSVGGLCYFSIIMVSSQWGRSNLLLIVRTARSVKSVADSDRALREYIKSLKPLPEKGSLHSSYLVDDITFVIGESASRNHLDIYGYPLPTTPVMSAMKDSLAIFSDAISASTSTAENIPRLLSFMPDAPTDKEWWAYPSMIDIFKALGYHTAWISNQERSGLWSNVSSALSSSADYIKYVGSEDSEDHLLTKYDEALIPPYLKFQANNNGKRFSVIHLMGSHTEYHRRYPRHSGRFDAQHTAIRPGYPKLDDKKARRVAQYDNSILYTDSILGVLIENCASSRRAGMVVYLSDHGENVYDTGETCGRDRTSVTVPLVIYLNRAYRELNPEMTSAIYSAIDRPISTANIIHLILSASGVSYAYYDPAYDVLSSHYINPQRYVDDEPYSPTCQ